MVTKVSRGSSSLNIHQCSWWSHSSMLVMGHLHYSTCPLWWGGSESSKVSWQLSHHQEINQTKVDRCRGSLLWLHMAWSCISSAHGAPSISLWTQMWTASLRRIVWISANVCSFLMTTQTIIKIEVNYFTMQNDIPSIFQNDSVCVWGGRQVLHSNKTNQELSYIRWHVKMITCIIWLIYMPWVNKIHSSPAIKGFFKENWLVFPLTYIILRERDSREYMTKHLQYVKPL